MKLNRLYILLLIFVILTTMSFDIPSPKFMDSTSKAQVEISLEEKESNENFSYYFKFFYKRYEVMFRI